MAAPFCRKARLSLLFRYNSIRPQWTHLIRLLVSQSSKAGEYVDKSEKSKEFKNPETHFGFQSVYEEEKEHKVYEVFENVASKYDLMNDAMSAGVHRIWKDIFLEHLAPSPGVKLLDVAGGTGDIAFRFLKYVNTPTRIRTHQNFDIPTDAATKVYMGSSDDSTSSSNDSTSSSDDSSDDSSKSRQDKHSNTSLPPDPKGSHVTVCDINQAMLDVGRQKSLQLGYTSGISWLTGNAEALPLSDNLFDAYTVAFGIRNCTHVQQVLNEAYRVLKPGGRFLCLEFSEVKNTVLRTLYDNYSFQVIPVMGQLIAGDWKSYQYLVESIRQFPNQEDFASMIKAAGFRMVTYDNLMFGVAAVHSGFKI
uniref:2-methoxy-6-polyprenyl-1,4-benzoquinol methylase, mitochondrial n=1 Tax=Arion vulgaris TaxID=1028688 RepID=A0A0B6ZFI8_9EUPU